MTAAGSPLHVEVKREAGDFSVYVNGTRLVDRESFTVADRIATMVRSARYDTSESAEVARQIRAHFGADDLEVR